MRSGDASFIYLKSAFRRHVAFKSLLISSYDKLLPNEFELVVFVLGSRVHHAGSDKFTVAKLSAAINKSIY